MWFPGMDMLVEKAIKLCQQCQPAVLTPHQEPLDVRATK